MADVTKKKRGFADLGKDQDSAGESGNTQNQSGT